jgi:hypothetical protein
MSHDVTLAPVSLHLLADVTGGAARVTRRVTDSRLAETLTTLKSDIESLAAAKKPAASDSMLPMMMMMMRR